jgi:transcription-repair coupling factor (superfamily II helicase)
MLIELLRILADQPEYRQIVQELEAGNELPALGLPRSVRWYLLSAIFQQKQVPTLIITDRSDRALKVIDELRTWLPGSAISFFPEPTPSFYEQASWGALVRRDRLQSLTYLAGYHIPSVSNQTPAIVVAPARAVMTRTMPRRDFIKSSQLIRKEMQISPESLQRSWVNIGYESTEIVISMGQFSRRGGLLDIWTPGSLYPTRLDFFGDSIETIRSFDPATQRTTAQVENIFITPARELLPGKALGLDLEAQELDEFYIPLVHPARASIIDYLPEDAFVFLDDEAVLRSLADEIEAQSITTREENIAEGLLDEDFPVPFLSWSEVADTLSLKKKIDLGFSAEIELTSIGELFQPGPRFGGRLKEFNAHLQNLSIQGENVFVVTRQVPRLKELYEEGIDPDYVKSQPDFIESTLSEGWVQTTADGDIHLLTDSEIFGWGRPEPRRQRKHVVETPETHYADLNAGDWVVHIDYGIGRYCGLVRRTVDGNEREFLMVEYEGGDQIYVPVHQADRLSKYIGPTADRPTATRLGTQEWSRAKKRVREAVIEIARDLLELYAKRQVAEGFAFGEDTNWQNELEDAFPYIETEDQLRAIQEVKNDMEQPRPMDRLLCGDVGYGKTEVALRAAFKAVMDGKQVAVLVPTTVLAQQHFETFRQRLTPFPVEVEMLSRFRTQKQQDDILKRIRRGSVDIVIGTHRLIQSDVTFKDLGLLIIDEEQRFGVMHKEHFKKLRTEIDVLTLTATPIPRTLYMALTGVRDISTIETPPDERMPVVTHIGPYSPRLVRQAIMRELERGGQIFFVHNRVRSIRAMEKHLNKLVPEARVGVGHGQMPERALERVMQRFTKGEIDILLCTSIIESGLDIPNANTLIVDRGDTFGLAQLYQLRGRVGRSAQRAHAYFFRHRSRMPTVEGLERLETIAEHTQLGAGYSIAMRDLEMRGAGELLGSQQHGNIASVGFHLYTQLLAQAVKEIKKDLKDHDLKKVLERHIEQREVVLPVNVDLPLPVGIPAAYISDQALRLQLYRRLAGIRVLSQLNEISAEFIDRFGPFPETVENLFYQLRIKLLAQEAGLASVTREADQIVFRFPPLPNGKTSRDLSEIGLGVRVGKNSYRYFLDGEENLKEDVEKILERIQLLG